MRTKSLEAKTETENCRDRDLYANRANENALDFRADSLSYFSVFYLRRFSVSSVGW
jgi:hypothetical protein